MSQVIAQLASTVPSEDLLAQIDIAEVYEKFHNTFKRLDDFKRVRDEHEQRSFLGRLFNRGELKNAQLDAQEVQAEFSKTLAQLMVISSLQAQQLTEQQNQLSAQQNALDARAEELARQNTRLEQHQAVIKHQAANLRTYVTELLKVQGLTDDHGEQLISIANEVLETRDKLLANFDERMRRIQGVLDEQQQLVREVLDEQSSTFEQAQAQLRQGIETAFEQRLAALDQRLLDTLEARHRVAVESTDRLSAEITSQAQQQEYRQADLNRQLSELREVLAEQEQTLRNERSERQQEQAERHTALEALRQAHSEAHERLARKQGRLLAGLCGLALAGAAAIGSMPLWLAPPAPAAVVVQQDPPAPPAVEVQQAPPATPAVEVQQAPPATPAAEVQQAPQTTP
ncbi:hypothetical protein ACIP1T_13000 [Pseudomonas japonica]|uniref:hypothetical protein n=1 Tax=Pseudomonas japonica TaxID=256466 RepID=UPI003825420F